MYLLVFVQPVQSAAPRLPYDYDIGDKMHYCQWFSVQAAWGAQARFKGAPAAFRYVNRDRLRAWFMADDAPPDAVYLLDELTAADRPLYEEVALAGWRRMDEWLHVTPGMKQPDWVLLPVPFYYLCKDGRETGSPVEQPLSSTGDESNAIQLISAQRLDRFHPV
jgi:hypothetical protein